MIAVPVATFVSVTVVVLVDAVVLSIILISMRSVLIDSSVITIPLLIVSVDAVSSPMTKLKLLV